MIREWKRILLNRSVVGTAAVLLLVNLGIFWLVFWGNPALYNDQSRLLEALESGEASMDVLREELTGLTQVQQFFVFENAKQNHPEFYETVYQNQEAQAREDSPELAQAFDRGEYEEQAVQNRITTLSAVLSSLDYTYSFYEKLNDVFANADKLSGISIFQNSGDIDPNLTKTTSDYRRLEQIKVTPGNDAPINALLGFGVPPLLGLIFACILVSLTLAEQQYGLRPLSFAAKHGRGKLTVCRCLGLLFGNVIFGILLYGLTILLSASLLGGVDPVRMVQSVPALFSLTVPMTIGDFLWLYLACGIGVQVMLTMMVWLSFTVVDQRQMAFLTIAGAVGISWLLYRVIPAQSFLAVLKYANPAAAMDFMGCLTVYRNLGAGSALVEKNGLVLVTGIMMTMLSAAFTIRCGMMRYPISSHGKLYWLVQKWMKALSVRYHAAITKLGFGGLECYKVLITQKGALVLAVLCFLLIQSYPVREITYVGEAQFMCGFYKEFSGEGITPELERYVSNMQSKLDDLESEYLESKIDYENGEISISEYLSASQKYAAFDVQRKALGMIQEKMAWVESQEALGYDAVILDSTGYDRLLEQTASDRILVLIALFGCIFLSALLFPMEQKQGLRPMIRSTRMGRQILASKKLMLGLVLSALVFGLYAGIRMGAIGLTFGFDCLTAPAHSLMQFGQSRLNLPVWVMLAGWMVSQWLIFGLASVLVCLLTQKMSMVGSIMTGMVLSMGTAVLNLFGIPVPTVWSLMEQPTVPKCGMLGILIVAGWGATVRLWSGNRRERT